MSDSTSDPLTFFKNLSADQIAESVQRLERELSALRVLLRSLRVRERSADKTNRNSPLGPNEKE
ncbi:MAG: hypothetical protein ACJ8C4_13300 [Gemmataceae bacterium]